MVVKISVEKYTKAIIFKPAYIERIARLYFQKQKHSFLVYICGTIYTY